MADQATEVSLPLMGEGVNEATLVAWLKKPGDKVEQDEALLEVSTDKVDTEIPSPASGYLVKTWAEEGTIIYVNDVIAHIADSPDAQVSKPEKSAKPIKKKGTGSKKGATAASGAAQSRPMPAGRPTHGAPQPLQVQHGERIKSSPLVRKMARDHEIDLQYVPGTGLGGRITRRDLDGFIAMTNGQSGGFGGPFVQPKLPAHIEWGQVETRIEGEEEYLDGVRVRREPMSKMRGLIAEHMARSVRTSPHVSMTFEMDLNKIVAIREANKDAFEKSEGFKLTYTHFFLHLAAETIKKHPVVNVSIDGEDILWKDEINIGCAVAIESGLIVPVLKGAQKMDLVKMAHGLNDLVVRARSKKLDPTDVQGGTFSTTNPGMFGSYVATPIINQPQVAILVINGIVQKPVVVNGDIVVRPMIQIGLTFDHRVVDGEGGAKFLATYKQLLESYESPF